MKISGHQREKAFLREAAAASRIHQSYLFCGADGIGKRLVAEWFASFLFCEARTEELSEPCFKCQACLKIQHRTHPDFKFIEKEEGKKDISVKQMRALQLEIQMRPIEAACKVIIINDADNMNPASANSMLKTLEEPPSDTHFILISSRPHMLLPTILSRCQKIQFSPLSLKEVEKFLIEEKNVKPTLAAFASQVSSGSLGAAINFPEEAMSECEHFIKSATAGIGPAEVVATVERWSRSSELQFPLLASLAAIYNDIESHRAGASGIKFKNLSGEISNIAASTPRERLKKRVAAIFAAQNELEMTYNKQLMFEQLLFTLQS